jgi:hypothetical protein
MHRNHVGIRLAAVAVLCGCSTPPTSVVSSYHGIPILRDNRPKFILVSWRTPAREDAFALFSSDREMYQFLDGFQSTAPHITLAELEQRLAKLPKKCLVSWMADPNNKIDSPRPLLKRRVKTLTDRREIDLQFNGIITEATGA